MHFEQRDELASCVAGQRPLSSCEVQGPYRLGRSLTLTLSLSFLARMVDAYREGISAYLVCLSYGFYGVGCGSGFLAYPAYPANV